MLLVPHGTHYCTCQGVAFSAMRWSTSWYGSLDWWLLCGGGCTHRISLHQARVHPAVGVVNKVGTDYLGLLVMGVFNASIAKADMARGMRLAPTVCMVHRG